MLAGHTKQRTASFVCCTNPQPVCQVPASLDTKNLSQEDMQQQLDYPGKRQLYFLVTRDYLAGHSCI